MSDIDEKKKSEVADSQPGPVYVMVMDIIRFFMAWAVITFLWVLLNVCPECGQHHAGHGNLAPYAAGFIGAIIFHVLRLLGRRDREKTLRKDNEKKS